MKSLLPLILLSQSLYAHSGRTNKEGCHNDNSRGEYHCHHGYLKGEIFKTRAEAGTEFKTMGKPVDISVGYNRRDWPHWTDMDGDCQNTRAEMLLQMNIGKIKFKRNKPCNVSWGKWKDPYTGKEFLKASEMDIDHIVPLKHAYDHGA